METKYHYGFSVFYTKLKLNKVNFCYLNDIYLFNYIQLR